MSVHRLAVALLLVLAGCGSVSSPDGDREPTPTATPVPVPTDASGGGSGDALAPGLATTGVYAPDRLARAHASALAGRSFTLERRVETTGVDGTLRQRDRSVLRYGPDRRRFAYDLVQVDRRGERETRSRIRRYADGERVFVALTRGNRTNYSLLRGPDGALYDPERVFPQNATGERTLERVLLLADTRVRERSTVDGVPVYRVATLAPQSVPPLENLSLVAQVTADGLVRGYHLTYEADREGRRTLVDVRVTYRRVGETTVEPPPWVEVARAATGVAG